MIKNLFAKRSSSSRLSRTDWLVLIGALIMFAVISLWTITKSSVWFDEAFGAYLIRFNFWDIAYYTSLDVHPPLYYWLLKLWSLLFGTSELALRSMSMLFALVTVTFAFLLTHRLFGRKAAWLSTGLLILSPMFIRYSQEMRMYMLVTAIALAASYVMVLAIETRKRKLWVIYGILVGLGMLTHYFVAIVWITHWLWRAWTMRKQHEKLGQFLKRFFSKDWIIAHVVAIGVFLFWLPSFVRQVFDIQIHGFWIPPVSPVTVPNFFTNVLYYQDQDTVSPWMTLLLVSIVIITSLVAVRLYQRLDDRQRQSYMLFLALAFVPIILLFVLSMPPLRSSFVDRYLMTSVVGIALFVGTTLAIGERNVKPLWGRLCILLIIIGMVIGVGNVYQMGNYNKTLHTSNNTRQAVEAVAENGHDGEPIIADSPWLFYEAVFYSNDRHPIYFIDANTEYKYGSLEMLRVNDQHKIKDLSDFARQHPIIWYLGRPGANNLTAPSSSWQTLQQVEVNDSISNKPSYKAIQYRTAISE
jgi:mannosyltransferase